MANTKEFIPICRYGHGEMKPIRNTFGTDWYAVQAVDRLGAINFSAMVLRMYKCPACTYTEMHDVDQAEFDAKVAEEAATLSIKSKVEGNDGSS